MLISDDINFCLIFFFFFCYVDLTEYRFRTTRAIYFCPLLIQINHNQYITAQSIYSSSSSSNSSSLVTISIPGSKCREEKGLDRDIRFLYIFSSLYNAILNRHQLRKETNQVMKRKEKKRKEKKRKEKERKKKVVVREATDGNSDHIANEFCHQKLWIQKKI